MATKTRAVQWINPNITQVNYAGAGEVEFIIDGKETLGIDDLVYFRRFSPLDDVGFGVGAAEAALSSAKLLFYLNEFSGTFFEHGAMPAVLLGIPQGTSNDERDRLEGWFKRAASGFRNAWKALAVKTGPDGISPTVLTPDMAKMAMPELYEQAKQQIAQAFEIPQTMLEDAANYATAGEHRQQFWHDTIRPEGEYLQEVINDQLLRPMGYEVVFDFDQMDQFQVDEEERATAFFNYVNSRAVPPSVAAEMLGLELPENIEYASLDEWYREQTIERPLALQQTAGIGVVEEQEALPEETPRKAFEDEVQVWRRRVLKRLKAGKPANGERDFYSDIIPEVLIETVQAQLEQADEAKANLIFDNLIGWEGYP
jgi:HK97 family phage portal protein